MSSNTRPPLPPIERDPRQPADFDPVAVGRQLLRATRVGALGTLDAQTGFPVTTLVSIATDLDGAPIILVSGLSHHTKNLAADPRCSVLLVQAGKGDPLAHPRLTMATRAIEVDDAIVRRRFLARHPKAALYVDFPDFRFYRLEPLSIAINGGFARAFDGDARYILSDIPDREAFAALEESAVTHMNDDHPDTVTLYASTLSGMPKGKWKISGIDPHGVDLALGDQVARVSFVAQVTDAKSLHTALRALAEAARATPEP